MLKHVCKKQNSIKCETMDHKSTLNQQMSVQGEMNNSLSAVSTCLFTDVQVRGGTGELRLELLLLMALESQPMGSDNMRTPFH